MGFGKLRFRRSFGQVKSQFRGAIPKHFPLVQNLLDLYPATAAYSAYDLGNKRGAVTETEGGTRYVVSGAGTAAVNGEYVENGLSANGNKAYTLYSNGAVAFNMWSYSSTGWLITSSAVDSSPVFEDIYYEELTASTTPPALLSAAFSGALPTPTVASLTTRTVVNPVQRWRRSSDDALQMFTANDIASGTALTWAGTTAYLLTEYDQSGNDYDITQTTAANQPLVVSGGALTVDSNNNYAPLFDGVDDGLAVTAPVLTGSAFFITSVIEHTTGISNPSGEHVTGQYEVTTSGRFRLTANPSDEYSFFANATDSISGLATGAIGTTQTMISINGDGSNAEIWRDGVSKATDVYSGFTPAAINFTIGFDADGSKNFNGNSTATLVYNTDQSANRAAIEAKLSTIVTTAIS